MSTPAHPAVKYEIPTDAQERKCSGCYANIFWVVTPNGKKMPLDADGTPHWATCPNAAKFRNKRKAVTA